MKNNKKLFFLSLALVLVGCGGGASTSQPSSEAGSTPIVSESSSDTSIETSVEPQKSNMEIFKETYDAIGKNYYTFDAVLSLYDNEDGSVDAVGTFNEAVVTDKGVVNVSNRSGIALANEGVEAYRFGIDLEAEEIDSSKMFLPSYKPANMYYNGFNAPEGGAIVQLNKNTYDILYRMPSSAEIEALSDAFYSEMGVTKLPKFEGMFTESVDEDGNVTFETNNIAVTMQFLDYNSFGRLDGYAELYNNNVYNYFSYSLERFGEQGIKTVVTLLEDDGFSYLLVQVFLSDFSEEYPYIERQIIPLSVLPDYQLEQYDLVSYIVPEDFYSNGPGEEPEESVAARALFKSQLENLMDWNYTFNFSGSSDVLQGAQYEAKYLSDTFFQSGGKDFCYSYYYVPVDETQPDIALGGIYGYEESTGVSEEFSMLSTKEQADQLVEELKKLGYPYSVSESGTVITYTHPQGGDRTIDLSEYIRDLYVQNFGLMYLLSEEFNAEYEAYYNGLDYWEVNYGCEWIDLFYYNDRTGEFLLTDYYLKGAFLGCCILFINVNESLTVDFLPGLTAEETPIISAQYYAGMHYEFGVGTFSDVGTTKASYDVGTYVNNKYGFTYGVEDAPVAE